MVETELPLVSVLTPVRNGAEFIEECIVSVLRQTYTSWSYTIVDNCSGDGTPDLVDRLARSDSRIRLVRFEEPVGAIENHNRAFDQAEVESTFCKIVQADDWLYPECLERMVARAQESSSIGVVGAYMLRDARIDLVGLPYRTTVIEGGAILRQSLLGGPYVTGSPTATLLRTELVRSRDPFYDPGLWHGDTEALYWAFTQADLGFVHQVLTYSRRQQGARSTRADRVGTYLPENLIFLLRYGPTALCADEYRDRLRFELRKYVSWHGRQALKPSRLGDSDFVAFHRDAAERIARESDDDPSVKAAMGCVRLCLAPRRTRYPRRRGSASTADGPELGEEL